MSRPQRLRRLAYGASAGAGRRTPALPVCTGAAAHLLARWLLLLTAITGCTARDPQTAGRAEVAGERARPTPLVVGLLVSEELQNQALERGLFFATAEAGHTLSLLGRPLVVERPTLPSEAATEAAVHDLVRTGARIAVAVLGAADLDLASSAAGEAGLLLIDARPRHDAGRRCAPWTFHVGVPERLAGGGTVALWSPSLDRYGAAQVNERFRRRMERDMDETAWAAWIAFKIAAEASLRALDGSPAAIRDLLLGGRAEFDGHKGAPLSFSRHDHQLQQPLVTSDGKEQSLSAWPATDTLPLGCR